MSGDPLEVALASGHLTDGKILGGVVDGWTIHWDCAEPRELHQTWAAFYQHRNVTTHNLICDRCGNRMIDGKASK